MSLWLSCNFNSGFSGENLAHYLLNHLTEIRSYKVKANSFGPAISFITYQLNKASFLVLLNTLGKINSRSKRAETSQKDYLIISKPLKLATMQLLDMIFLPVINMASSCKLTPKVICSGPYG